ncbi:MAG: hypothetical protein KGJ89_05070 [Patescibacteria group bacterium]|nr:hypothetical protein [Patescibacteria group bacterium]
MANLGAGSGTGYPGVIDVQTTPEVDSPSANKSKARAAVPNDLASAVIAVETALGTNPQGSKTDVKTFLQTEHNANGTHNNITVSGGLAVSGGSVSGLAAPTNILPNTQWQVCTGGQGNGKWLPDGTGAMPAISVSSYTTGSNTVVCTTSNTGQLKVGDLVTFSAAADANMKICSIRVDSLVVNTSFTGTLPLGLAPSASAACTATPTMVGQIAASGNGPDGWTKATTLNFWREDNAVNLKTGSLYSLGVQKGSASAETLYSNFVSPDIYLYRGKTLVFGVWVMQKIKGGSGTWNSFISSDGTGGATNNSASSTAGVGTWTWLEVSYTVPSDATTLSLGINFAGNNADVYYVSQPMGAIGSYLGSGNYCPRLKEILIPIVKYTPLSYNGASVSFPASADGAGTYSFNFKVEPETNGCIAPTVKLINITFEGVNSNAAVAGASPRLFAMRDVAAPPIKYGPIMGQTVSNMKSFITGQVQLSTVGQAVFYSGVASDSWYNVSIDINGYVL